MMSRMRAAERDVPDIFSLTFVLGETSPTCHSRESGNPGGFVLKRRGLWIPAFRGNDNGGWDSSQLEPDHRQQNHDEPQRGDAEGAAAAQLLFVGLDARFGSGFAFLDQAADPLQAFRPFGDEAG